MTSSNFTYTTTLTAHNASLIASNKEYKKQLRRKMLHEYKAMKELEETEFRKIFQCLSEAHNGLTASQISKALDYSLTSHEISSNLIHATKSRYSFLKWYSHEIIITKVTKTYTLLDENKEVVCTFESKPFNVYSLKKIEKAEK